MPPLARAKVATGQRSCAVDGSVTQSRPPAP